jgi:hypothetical protein
MSREIGRLIDSGLDLSGIGTTRAEDAQGTPTQSHISPSILAYEDYENVKRGLFKDAPGAQRPCLTPRELNSHKVFFKSFCQSQFPHKSVNLSLIFANTTDKLTDLCGN